MSASGSSSISFDICNEQMHLRLLELPSAVVDLIASDGLSKSNLTLKSALPGIPNDTNQTLLNAVLCTEDKTYQIRQVQSSNSVFVLQPSSDHEDPRARSHPSNSLSAIAQCPITLELVPTSPPAISFLKKLIPFWDGSEATASEIINRAGKSSILGDVPFSNGELGAAWKALCIFELEEQAWLPTATWLVSVWKSIVQAATLRDMNLEDRFALSTLSGAIEEDGFPNALFRAVVDRLGEVQGDHLDEFAVLNPTSTVLWVGAVMLESQGHSTEGIHIPEFLREWQNLLPEVWRGFANLEIIKGKYSLSSNRIIFKKEASEIEDPTVPVAESGKNSRKWHEKFKDARR